MIEGLVVAGNDVLSPLFSLWDTARRLLPGIGVAILILILGYVISSFLGFLVRVVLDRLKVDVRARKAKLMKKAGQTSLSNIFGEITKWYIFIIFLQVAVEVMDLGTLSELLNMFVLWLPNVIAAVLVLLFGLGVAHFVEMKINEHSKMAGVSYGAKGLRVVIVILTAIVALTQIGIETSILENTFLILVAGFSLGIALAFGLGFGLSMKDAKWFNKLKK